MSLEKLFASHTSDKSLVSRAYKKLSKLNKNRQYSIRKWGRDISPKRTCVWQVSHE